MNDFSRSLTEIGSKKKKKEKKVAFGSIFVPSLEDELITVEIADNGSNEPNCPNS
jgi:hypothetical protein